MYVVTGATGNTGSVVAKHLLAHGKQVRVIGRTADRLQTLAKLGAEPFVADITDAEPSFVPLPQRRQPMSWSRPTYAAKMYSRTPSVFPMLASAIEMTRVKNIVALSSIGADKTEKTGSVIGLTHLEQKLRRVAGLNLICIRSGYFIENTLTQIEMLRAMGKTGGPLRGNLKLPMIATRDLGVSVADALLKLNFRGKQTQELLGQRDPDMNEVTTIIGKAIGKPDLQYVRLPPEQVQPGLVQVGMSGNMADLLLEMSDSLNSGHIRALEERTLENTTLTSFETFVTGTFVPLYKRKAQVA